MHYRRSTRRWGAAGRSAHRLLAHRNAWHLKRRRPAEHTVRAYEVAPQGCCERRGHTPAGPPAAAGAPREWERTTPSHFEERHSSAQRHSACAQCRQETEFKTRGHTMDRRAEMSSRSSIANGLTRTGWNTESMVHAPAAVLRGGLLCRRSGSGHLQEQITQTAATAQTRKRTSTSAVAEALKRSASFVRHIAHGTSAWAPECAAAMSASPLRRHRRCATPTATGQSTSARQRRPQEPPRPETRRRMQLWDKKRRARTG